MQPGSTATKRPTPTSFWAEALQPLLAAAMELAWLYMWLVLLGALWFPGERALLPLSGSGLLFVAGLFMTKVLLRRQWLPWEVQIAAGCAGFLAMVALLRVHYPAGYEVWQWAWFPHLLNNFLNFFTSPSPLVVAFFASAYLWWRSIRIAAADLDFDDLYRRFVLGFVAVVAFILVALVFRSAVAVRGLLPASVLLVGAFFLFGLLALSISRLQFLQEQARQKGSATEAFRKRWLSTLLALASGIVVLGWAGAALVSPDFIALIGRFLGMAADLLYRLVYLLLLPISVLAAGFFYLVRFIVALLRGNRPMELPQLQNLEPFRNPDRNPVTRGLPPEFLAVVKGVLLTAVIVLVLVVFIQAMRRRRQSQTAQEVEETHEGQATWNQFLQDLRTFLAFLFRWLRRSLPAPVQVVSRARRGDEGPGDNLEIREIYRRLLRQGRQAGVPKRESQTPFEYQETLLGALPSSRPEVHQITGAYVRARYGDDAPSGSRGRQLNALWRTLYGKLREAVREQKGRSSPSP